MQNLVTKYDFKKPYTVDFSTTDVETAIDNIINIAQIELLTKILGHYELQKLIEDLNNTTTPTAQIWKDFVNGAEYLNNTKTVKYNGIVEPITLYCYDKITRLNSVIVGRAGESFPEYENSVKSKAFTNFISANNRLVNIVKEFTNSVYNFLDFNKSNYPDWEYTGIVKINNFGI